MLRKNCRLLENNKSEDSSLIESEKYYNGIINKPPFMEQN
jgi:hypothetical protein